MGRALALALVLVGCDSTHEVIADGDCPGGAGQPASQIVENAQQGCLVDADCTVVDIELSCFRGGFEPVLASKLQSVQEQLKALDQRVCPGKTCSGDVGGGDPRELACASGLCAFVEPDAGPLFPIPAGYVGYFHELGIPEALNLELTDDGRYTATLYSCDVQEAFAGFWSPIGTPANSLSVSREAGSAVSLSLGDGGLLSSSASLFFDDGGIDLLAPGAVCAVCDGGSPMALVPCDHPFGF